MSDTERYEAIVIGGGKGGKTLANSQASQRGSRNPCLPVSLDFRRRYSA
jgi:hypothetical protein